MAKKKPMELWYEEMKEIMEDVWTSSKMVSKEDICPNCGCDELRGFANHDVIFCQSCEWTINKVAWLEAWK